MGLWTCIFSTDAHVKNIERHSIKYVSQIDILLNFFQFTYDTDPIWFTVHNCSNCMQTKGKPLKTATSGGHQMLLSNNKP